MTLNRLIDYVSWMFLATSLVVITLFDEYVENIVYGKQFVLKYLILGIVLAGGWTFIHWKINRTYFQEDETRKKTILGSIFSIVILTIFLNGFITHKDISDTYQQRAIVLRKSENLIAHRNYVFLSIEGRKERFLPTHSEYSELNEGDTIMLVIVRSRNGFEAIKQFKKK
jgi:hypothetical protein